MEIHMYLSVVLDEGGEEPALFTRKINLPACPQIGWAVTFGKESEYVAEVEGVSIDLNRKIVRIFAVATCLTETEEDIEEILSGDWKKESKGKYGVFYSPRCDPFDPGTYPEL